MKNKILELAQEQEVGEWVTYSCPFCPDNRKRRILSIKKELTYIKYNCFSTNCQANGDNWIRLRSIDPKHLKDIIARKEPEVKSKRYELPSNFTHDIPQEFIEWLNDYHIEWDLIRRYGIGYCPEHSYNDRVIFNDRLIIPTPSGFLARSLTDSTHKWKNFADFDFRSIYSPERDTIVIVEDPLSCIRVGEILPSICLLGTSLKEKQFIYLRKYKKILIWTDGDSAGIRSGIKIGKQLSPYIQTKRINTKHDPKVYSYEEMKEILNEDK